MSFCTVRGISCYYEKTGSGERSVVLLHGWGQNVEMMRAIALWLQPHFTVYNLDLPGFGRSSEPPEAYGVPEYTDFLRDFLTQFGVEEPIIIAQSFGCRMALHYAHRYPVRKMVLTGAAGVRDKRGLKWYWKTYTYKLGKKVMSLPPLKKYLKALQECSGSEDYRNASGVMRASFVKVVNDDVSPFLKDIPTETLLVFGEKDEATPLSKGRYMEKMMPNAVLVTFAGDDHYAYFHQADRFNRVLEAFLKNDYCD